MMVLKCDLWWGLFRGKYKCGCVSSSGFGIG